MNIFNQFILLTNKVVIFIKKHTVESEPRTQQLTKYQQRVGGQTFTIENYHFPV